MDPGSITEAAPRADQMTRLSSNLCSPFVCAKPRLAAGRAVPKRGLVYSQQEADSAGCYLSIEGTIDGD